MLKSLACLFSIAALTGYANAQSRSQKVIVGAVETIRVENGDLEFRARVDTGAATCSIHAVDIEVDATGDPKGKPISFRVVNENGISRTITSNVDSISFVKTSEGSDQRYKVPLTLTWNATQKTVLVTLNERGTMKYRLLLGRNWLSGDFLVDVDKNHGD